MIPWDDADKAAAALVRVADQASPGDRARIDQDTTAIQAALGVAAESGEPNVAFVAHCAAMNAVIRRVGSRKATVGLLDGYGRYIGLCLLQLSSTTGGESAVHRSTAD